MGNCCNNRSKEEQNNEMKDGIFPNYYNIEDEDVIDEGKNEDGKGFKKSLFNFSHNYYQQDSMDSEFINADQKKSEEIFNYFNDVRNNPQNYLSEAQKYGLQKVISTATEKAVEGNIKSLIKNTFFELYFDKLVKATPQSKGDLIKILEKEEILKDYEKKLYMVFGDVQNIGGFVWDLLKSNENDELLWKHVDYLVISVMFLEDKKNIWAYFLFLNKK